MLGLLVGLFLANLRFCGGLDIWFASDPREIAILFLQEIIPQDG